MVANSSADKDIPMKRILLTSVVFLAPVGTMHAADLPAFEEAAPIVAPVPDYGWTGFYAGVHGGYTFGDNDDNFLVFDTDLDGRFDDTVRTPLGADAFSPGFESDSDDGFNGGGRLGYDQQFGGFLLGVVGEVSYFDIGDEVTGNSTTPAFYTFERDLDFLASGRVRGGVAFDRFLVYATGGFAYGSIDYSFETNSPANLASVSEGDEDAWGYTVGGGVEALLTSNVSIGLEYLYTDLDVDTQTARFDSGPFAADNTDGTDIRADDDEFAFHTIRGVLTYRFNSGL
jgi:outer membrane immunogenic protein